MRQRHQLVTPGRCQGEALETLKTLREEAKHKLPTAQVFLLLRIQHRHQQRELLIGEVSAAELEPLMLAAGLGVFGGAFAILRRHLIRQEEFHHLLLNAAARFHRLRQGEHSRVLRVEPMRHHAARTGEGLARSHAAGDKHLQHLARELQPLAHHAQVDLSPNGRLPRIGQRLLTRKPNQFGTVVHVAGGLVAAHALQRLRRGALERVSFLLIGQQLKEFQGVTHASMSCCYKSGPESKSYST